MSKLSLTEKSLLSQGAIMELSAVRAARASSNAALEKTLYTLAGGLASVPSTNSTEIVASTVDCSAVSLWA